MASVSRSKTAVPGRPPEFLRRPTLLAALDRGADRALTLVCAPPGYGKTLLLADWVDQQQLPVAWVTLDEDDDDPRRLWTAVLAALAVSPAVPETSRLRTLVVPRTTVSVDFLSDVLEALAALPTQITLVLDDAHHLRSKTTLQGVHQLLRASRSAVRLILASRFDPALPVARLRLEERLCELRTEQLAFTPEETATLAARCGLALDGEQTAQLHERTDGWVAGIRLAAMPLRGHRDPDVFLADFSGDDRPVADYLTGEVFAHISADDADLLRRASISDPVPAALAAELSGRADAADALGALERTTGLVIATGEHRTEFRIQELIRSYLIADLYRHGPALAAELHRRAALWWADQGRPVPALRHAARGADDGLMTALLHRWSPQLVASGEHAELRRALDRVAGSAAATDPWIPLISAHLHLAAGDLRAARVDVVRAGTMTAPYDDDRSQYHAALARSTGLGASLPRTDGAPADPTLAALALVGGAMDCLWTGRPEAGTDVAAVLGALESALAMARDQHLELLEVQCLTLIGIAASTVSDNARAASAASAALTAATGHGWQDSWWAATAHAVLGHARLLRAEPDLALDAAADGLRLCPGGGDPVLRFALRTARGGALFDLGDRSGGLLELQEAHAELGGARVPERLAVTAAMLEHRAALLLGSTAASTTSMGRLADAGSTAAEVTLMRAWGDAAAGATQHARATVRPLLDGTLAPTLDSTLVEAWLLEVWGALRSGDRPAARQAMRAALAHAEPRDILRPFALAGQGQRILLVDQLGGDRDPAVFPFRCLAARRRVRRSAAPPLSAREQDVLAQLVSLSNLGEIADDLAVSVNTVKSHVRAIYGKLGVNTRRNAVLTALERGMLA